AQAVAQHFHRPYLGRVAMAAGVTLVEPVPRRSERNGGQPASEQSFERRTQFVSLAGVAQVEFAREAGIGGGHSFGGKLVARLAFQLSENILGMIGGDLR